MKCPNCGHQNDVNASFCENCGRKFVGSGGISNLTKALIVGVIVLVGLLGVLGGYTYFLGSKNPDPPVTINQTVNNSTSIPYSSEYITFDKAKSIAIQNAAQGVSVSDPILMKNSNGQAIYLCYYYYNGQMIGGIIINAKTGDILYKEQNLPPNNNNTNSNNNNQQSNSNNVNNQNNSGNNGSGHWETCPTCDGTGYIPDPNNPYNEIVCPTCNGKGQIWVSNNGA
jgi:hypothetical protein